MDYNDNDYEGQNLHLAGEESSKVSSVLCPYPLPKFDFDDSLQGHLRFDSLVENEVFLGIASQEDTQWIEDFSRGSSGIEFRSSAAESCSLPRRNNVWSEATSSESVEMLLKAVGQEEMVPGEDIVEETDPGEAIVEKTDPGEAIVEKTDPGDQFCGTMEPMETNLKQDDKIDDVKDPNSTLTPGEPPRNVSVLNQSAGVQGVTLPAEGIKVTADGSLDVNSENTSLGETRENLHSDTEYVNHSKGEPSTSANESLRDKMQENLSVSGIQNDNTESSLQKVTVSVGESYDLDNVCDIETVSLSGLDKDICTRVEEEKKELNTDDEMLGGSDAETVNSKLGSAFGVASKMECAEEHAVEISVSKFGDPSSVPEKGDSLLPTLELSEEDIVEPGDGSKCASVALSVVTEIKQQNSGENKLDEGSSVAIQAEGHIQHATEGKTADALEICSNSELKMGSAIPSSDGQRSSIDKEDIYHGSNNMTEAPPTTFEASSLSEVQGNPSEQDNETHANPANNRGNLTDASLASACVGEMKDASDVAGMHTEGLNDEDHDGSSLLSGSMQMYGETNRTMQSDSLKCDRDLSACQKGVEKLNFVGNDMSCDDNEKEVGSSVSGEGVEENVDLVHGSESKTRIGERPVLNTEVEDTNLASHAGDHNEERDSPVNDMGSVHIDENEETGLEVPEELRTSILGGSLEMADKLAPVSEPHKAAPCDSAVEAGWKTIDQSTPVMETADAATRDKASQELSENLEACPVREMIVQEGDGAEPAPIEKPMDEKIERNHGATSLIDPVTGGSVETDQSNQVSSGGISCPGHARSERDEQESLKGPVPENVHKSGGETPTHPGSNDVSNEEGTFTFDVGPLARQSKGEPGESSQSFPTIQTHKISMAVKGSPPTSSNRQVDAKVVPEISHGSPLALDPLALDGRAPPGGLKGPSERKARRGSGKSLKESGKKGVKETTLKQNERGDKSRVSLSPSVTGQLMQFETGNVERSATKPSGIVSVPTSYLPDLNTSAPASALFHQPFTDLQQVQLRAQIFVYGSLIQGAAPDEACMVSAFDGGRSIWEPSWRACVDRIHSQKSQGNISETPVQSRSGAKAPDQASKQGLPQSKVVTSSAGRASSKASLLPAVNPLIPLSSPLWNISTPSCDGLPSSNVGRSAIFDYQTVSPLHPYQTPPIRNFVSPTTSWPSQAPFPGPWVASSQSSAFDIGTQYSAFPVTEPVKLTPVKELSMPISSGAKHVKELSMPISSGAKHASPSPVAHSGASSALAVPFSLVDMKKASISSGQNSTDTKSRKRKKDFWC
ncbi:protein SWOLLEN 1 [Abeliophyllum distichum]|uniref:Protein SWOLLEN 1 n=1 Tax=Abeliophyllum distichum TaxID=126358 RepID=A0ABD1Q8D4_9LAMI